MEARHAGCLFMKPRRSLSALIKFYDKGFYEMNNLIDAAGLRMINFQPLTSPSRAPEYSTREIRGEGLSPSGLSRKKHNFRVDGSAARHSDEQNEWNF